MKDLVCWHCGVSLSDIPKPLVRLAQCKACGADLHVCRLCKFYNPNHFEKCDHDMAEPAREVDIANFCHYFRPRPNACNSQEKTRSDDAMAQLKALFGETDETQQNDENVDKTSSKDDDKAKFDALFKKE